MRYFYCILLITFLFDFSLSEVHLCDDNCPPGEVYSRCGAGTCEPNCWVPEGEPECGCYAGCVCGPGLIRDPNTFKCISPMDCPLRAPGECPSNETTSECMGSCQRTCDTIDSDMQCVCNPGCICEDGLIRSSVTGQCIPISECSSCPPGYSKDAKTGKCTFCCQECPENEEYNECGSYCEADCLNPTLEGVICIKACKQGCFCVDGYVRDPNCGKCIPIEWCSKECPENESYACGNPYCEKDCFNYDQPCDIVNIRCEDKCFCNDGFVRREPGGPCVPIESCRQGC